jgi:quercetin dioxygenase-like cupin family protein
MSGRHHSSAENYFDRSTGEDGASGGRIVHMDELDSYEIAAGLFFRPLFGENVSLNFVTFPPNSGFPAHAHPEEQVSIVREGEMEFTVGATTRVVRPGDVIVMPPNVPHAGRTRNEACRLIDVFSPARGGIRDVIAGADPVRAAEVDRWWYSEASTD